MNAHTLRNVIERTEFRERSRVFRDRTHAGQILAEMLESFRNEDAMVMAIPAGGVPVAAVIAEKLHLPLEVAVVSKITLPWNTEAGYGAVAFDGTVRLNEDLLSQIRLTEREIQQGMDQTYQKVLTRVKKFRGNRAFPDLSRRPPILVDDGLASGFTLLVAVEALRKSGAQHIIVAVPTGHWSALQRTAREVEVVYCANIRSGWSFAVADAYERWWDMDEEEVARIYKQFSDSNRAVSPKEVDK
ncbi:MAG: phosphoribosyltransferase [Deltaproteobacteria bacterium]|nr:MAG: phosphoribosyltransferase [Deltaproteobacteria bacterium]